MCDNSRECRAAAARGFADSGPRRPLDDVPDATPAGGSPATVHPERELVDKLGVKPGMLVSLVGVDDPAVADAARSRSDNVSVDQAPRPGSAIVIYQAEDVASLQRIAEMRDATPREGAVWVLWPKGVSAIRQSDVQGAGLAAGLVDVKVARISDRLSGLKFVFRLADR